MQAPEATLTPHHIVQRYLRAHQLAYGKSPNVRYMGNQWYQVNGELVHRSDVLMETERLNEIARQHQHRSADKGMITRLIAKLRSL